MSEYELVDYVAEVMSISQYEVFNRAAKEYGPRMVNRFDRDFTRYLLTGDIPFYVRAYCRQIHGSLTKEQKYGNG